MQSFLNVVIKEIQKNSTYLKNQKTKKNSKLSQEFLNLPWHISLSITAKELPRRHSNANLILANIVNKNLSTSFKANLRIQTSIKTIYKKNSVELMKHYYTRVESCLKSRLGSVKFPK